MLPPSAHTVPRFPRGALIAVATGLALTVAALAVVSVDHATGDLLAQHIRAGYPSYSSARIDAAAMLWLVYLSVVAALGIVTWAVTGWAVRTGRRWAPLLATAAFVVGTGIAVFNLVVTDTSGDTGLPALLGAVGLLPSLPGLVAVVLLWRGRRPAGPRAAVSRPGAQPARR